ncbi:MAG: hypothetical protein J0M04_10520 [Verrucomicrobia bacterium]|nr:hypothetical protein [Verrucomicrobiota bacterium]
MKIHMLRLAMAIMITGSSHALRADEAGSSIPYNSVNRTMEVLQSQKVDGVDCVPFYIKSQLKGVPVSAKKANFRIRTWDGESEPLKLTLLSEIPEEKRTEIEKKLAGDGYTHVLWIPKGVKRFLDGNLVHDMPKGSITMTQGVGISGSIGPGAGKKQE